jgi:hypothetical protein
MEGIGNQARKSQTIESDWNTNRTMFAPSDPRHRIFGTPRKETLLRLAASTPAGCFVEFGVHGGGSAWRLARLAAEQGRECHLFDTFCGIPESTPEIDLVPVGSLADGVDVNAVRRLIPTAIFHVGVFPETMPPDLGPIAFAHIDCDQYRSYLAGIDRFYPLMVLDGIMLFDDYNVTPGAKRAVDEKFGFTIFRTREGKAFVRK